MRYSSLVGRIAGETVDVWKLYSRAVAARARGEDVIVLAIGDPDIETPKPIRDATVAALDAGDTHYVPLEGKRNLREAIASRYSPRLGREIAVEEVAVTAGAQNALFAAASCIAESGDEIAAVDPMYVSYEATVRSSGADMIRILTRPENGFHPTRDAIEASITERTRAIMFASPNNPTGAVLHKDEIEMIAEIATKHDLWVISDEVYGECAFDAPHYSIAALPGMAERTVTIASLSKSHAMTGWRVGWMIAPPTLIKHVANLALCTVFGLPGFVQEGGVAALATEDGWQASVELAAEIKARRAQMLDGLASIPMLKPLAPEGGMFVCVDVRETGLSAPEFAERLFEAEGVAVLDATAFGPSTAGFVRLFYGLKEQVIADALSRIQRFVATL